MARRSTRRDPKAIKSAARADMSILVTRLVLRFQENPRAFPVNNDHAVT